MNHTVSRDTEHRVMPGRTGPLVLGALGVVYGDIGTSPLYTLKTALEWGGGATPDVAMGMLSLIVWTLIVTTSIKYVALIMRADNEGEGGILALMALLGLVSYRLFKVLHRNAGEVTDFFRIPRERMIELGASMKI